MSNALTEMRADIKAALEAVDLGTVFDHVPGRWVPPAAIIIPGSPYVEQGETFGSHTVRFEVWIVTSKATNDIETADLDDRIDAAVAALAADGLSVERVDEPFTYQIQNANYLAVAIHVTTPVTFTP